MDNGMAFDKYGISNKADPSLFNKVTSIHF